MKTARFLTTMAATACLAGAVPAAGQNTGAQPGATPGAKATGSGPTAQVNPKQVQARVKTPPPATATQGTSIGKGKAMVKTDNSTGDTDSIWTERIDIDGDGTVEDTQFLWDDDDKILFAYAETDVPCKGGGQANVAVLVGVNGEGNPRGRAAGSGFYAAEFDALECGAATAGLYGCRFDAKGNVTEWVAASLDAANDTVILARAKSSIPNPTINPAAVQARAKSAPPATATKAANIGKGQTTIATSNKSGDDDSFWTERLDIDGDGTVEDTQLLWDDEDKVLFAYAETDVPCQAGGTAVVGLLIGVNGDGNPRGVPAGSGFCIAGFDAMECGAATAGLYGCRFDAKGAIQAWCEAELDAAGDTVVILSAAK
jgi:hypothetical protein